MTTLLPAKIILLEDEGDLRDEITDYFAYHGIEMHSVRTIKQFWQYAETLQPNLVILDRMLPDGDGLSVLQELRKAGSRCGVVMLTAKDSPTDLQQGLDNLADHYLSKPVPMGQLLAVVRSLAWRMHPIQVGWVLNPTSRTLVAPCGHEVALTTQEFAFIRCLAGHPHQPLSRQKIAEDVSQSAQNYDVRNLDALVLRLRKKMAQHNVASLPVRTVHGIGYAFTDDIKIVKSANEN